MSNFRQTFLKGKEGKNFGITTGIVRLDKAINGIQKKASYGIAAAPKCGKTTLADYIGVISPYLYMLKEGRLDDINWVYWSFEIDRVSKEFKFASFFMAYDYQIYNVSYKGKLYEMSQDYLMGRQVHENLDGTTEMVPIEPDHEEKLKVIYVERIVPIFGEYDEAGRKIRPGKIDFIEEAENPTGIHKYIISYARQHGDFTFEDFYLTNDEGKKEKHTRITGYNERNPNLYSIFITDHIRKTKRERGFSMKENIDKLLEYHTISRNICNFTFFDICHSNRGIANVDRQRFAGEGIFPTADDIKDTGNLAEESTVLITMFNANDEKYNLDRHMGVELKEYPNYRSIHIVESRYTSAPQHILVNMYGGINMFTPLNIQ